jgi:hypothetical protein
MQSFDIKTFMKRLSRPKNKEYISLSDGTFVSGSFSRYFTFEMMAEVSFLAMSHASLVDLSKVRRTSK